MAPSADGSSTSPRKRSRPSPLSGRGSRRSASPGNTSAGLGVGAIRDLARRHGIRPTKSLGQNFLIDPNITRLMASLAGASPGVRVLEVGAGLGALTVALAGSGAEVLAVEFDRALMPALREVVEGIPNIRVEAGDALRMNWDALLEGEGWKMVSNLPFNVAVPLLVEMLEVVPAIDTYVVMVQREVGERLAASPGDDAYGSVSVRVAYRADTEVIRRVAPSVFWPRPNVESVLVRLTPRPAPVNADQASLFRLVEEGFAERRKTMRNALRRLGLSASTAVRVMESCGLDPAVRAEELGLAEFGAIVDALAVVEAERGRTP